MSRGESGGTAPISFEGQGNDGGTSLDIIISSRPTRERSKRPTRFSQCDGQIRCAAWMGHADNGGTAPINMEDQGKDCGTCIDTIIRRRPTRKRSKRKVATQSFGDEPDDIVLIDYPLRHSPACKLLRPLPGVKTHPDYIWKQ